MDAGEAVALPITLLAPDSAYRTLGASREAGLIGIGVVDKSKVIIDSDDRTVDHYSALYVLRGSGEYQDSTGVHARFSQGSVIQRLCDRRHSLRFDPGARFVECFLALNATLASGLMNMRLIDGRRPVVHPGIDPALLANLRTLLRRLRAASEAELPRVAAEVIWSLVDLLTRDRALDPADPHAALIARACQALANGADAATALSAAVGRRGLSYERFRKIFRERIGISPGEYRLRRRIDRARELLMDGEVPIAEIAHELGYANAFAFSAQFRERVGMPPSEFRRHARPPAAPPFG
jgi:AraC family transcriptional regulator of arabinose operon